MSWSPEASTIAAVSLHKDLYDFGRLDTLGDALLALAVVGGLTSSTLLLLFLVPVIFIALARVKRSDHVDW
ncbi:MAG: hypothetical protein ABI591_26950 [Kofleriaceae bacterium]